MIDRKTLINLWFAGLIVFQDCTRFECSTPLRRLSAVGSGHASDDKDTRLVDLVGEFDCGFVSSAVWRRTQIGFERRRSRYDEGQLLAVAGRLRPRCL